MADRLASALDKRIREIFETAQATAARFAEAYKAETGQDHPLINSRKSVARTASAMAKTSGRDRAKRERRSPEQLHQQALAIVELIKSKGKEGADGKEIRANFSKVGQSIKDYVKKYGNIKLQTQGRGIAMRYFAAKS